MKSYRDLLVWQKSFNICVEIYELTKQLPETERYGLTSQLQRCAISVPSNIAEGQQRTGKKEFQRFLGISRGSAAELATQLLLAEKIYNLDTSTLVKQTEETQKMLYSLQSKL